MTKMTDTGIIVVFEGGVAKKVEIPIDSRFSMYGEDFMVHKGYKNKFQWQVTEVKSGALCSHPQDENGESIINPKPHKSKNSAIETAKKNLTTYVSKGKSLDTAINSFIERSWNVAVKKSNKNMFLKLKLLRVI